MLLYKYVWPFVVLHNAHTTKLRLGVKHPVTYLQVYEIKIQTRKGSNECLFILTQTHSMHIFGEIPFRMIAVILFQIIFFNLRNKVFIWHWLAVT